MENVRFVSQRQSAGIDALGRLQSIAISLVSGGSHIHGQSKEFFTSVL
jgi:hypothetical protein